jgi:hypothetical protein
MGDANKPLNTPARRKKCKNSKAKKNKFKRTIFVGLFIGQPVVCLQNIKSKKEL